jgi:serine/threonine protein kinase
MDVYARFTASSGTTVGDDSIGNIMNSDSGTTGEHTPEPDDSPGQLEKTTDHLPDAEPGLVIAGRYTLQQKVGEGGMGEVWVAKQTEPVKRTVALKLIKSGMDSKAVLQRFEQERQALALMDHPHIAKVLDGGLTPHRRPYFVMELVNGLPLNKFCDEAKLGIRERLQLFVPICQAVQHAHQKGIVHRDLKPSNILVTVVDGRPMPKVIDFGVAKATAGRLTDESMSTQFGAVVGTLEYMSPEQAGFSGEDIDTRADIYSLGVIAYELLTGLRPIDAQRLKTAAFTEMIRIIREEEPAKPSTRLSTNESLPSLAAVRQIEPRRLMALLRGDLDWIVMKCLEKQRDRRYETAGALSRDIQRYLDGEPVEACPPSVSYRLGKFLRRHKGPVLAAALVLLVLVGGIIGTTIGLIRAERQRIRATEAEADANSQRDKALDAARAEREAKDSAQRRLQQVEKGIEILGSIFKDLDPDEDEREGGKPLRALLGERLDAAANQLDGEAVGDPRAVAGLQRTLGLSMLGLGYSENAIGLFARARATFAAETGPDAVNTLGTTANLATAYRAAGQLDQAVPLFEQTLQTMIAKLGPDDPDTIDCMANLAQAYKAAGKVVHALPIYEKALELMKAKYGLDDSRTLQVTNNLAVAYIEADKVSQAVPLLELTLQMRQAKLGPDHADTVISMHSLAHAYRTAGSFDLALPLFKQSLEKWQVSLGPDHPYTLACVHNLAMTYMAKGQVDLAEPLLREVLRKSTEKHGPDHPDALKTMNQLASALRSAGKVDEALQLLEDCVQRTNAKLGPDHPDTLISINSLAGALKDAGRPGDSEVLMRGVVRQARDKLGFDHAHTQTYVRNLADCYFRLKQPERAEPLWRELAQFWRDKAGDDSPQHARELNSLGLNLIDQQKYQDAEPILRKCLTIRLNTEAELWTTFNTKSALGGALAGQKKYSDAEPLLLSGYEGMKAREAKIPAAGRARLVEAQERIVQLYEAWGKPEQAAEWRAKAE